MLISFKYRTMELKNNSTILAPKFYMKFLQVLYCQTNVV